MPVYKVLDLVGTSTVSWQDAVEEAVREAGKTVHNITGVEIVNNTAKVKDGQIVEYNANVHVAFLVDN